MHVPLIFVILALGALCGIRPFRALFHFGLGWLLGIALFVILLLAFWLCTH